MARLVLILLVLLAADAAAERRRALLIGINDYTATTLRLQHAPAPPPPRDWPNLAGATNDVAAMSELLTTLYDFAERDVVMLRDQSATRAAMLSAIEEHLVKPAARGDVVVFYYAGHGSQVRNSRSNEPDVMDESLVPADSRLGAADIRDKELGALFRRVVERGAHLTIILDNCHSGSGARGSGSRAIQPDLRDVADARTEKAPEDLGALVIAATQDFEIASEMRDDQGVIRGVFSWSWLRAMRDAAPDESAMETFLRAQARMRAESPFQDPMIIGNAQARARPLFGTRRTSRTQHTAIAVERVNQDGTVRLQGGWANGLSIGTKLRVRGNDAARLTIIALHGLSRSDASPHEPYAIRPGALLEIVAWAPPPARPLRVKIPNDAGDFDADGVMVTQRVEEADYVLTRRADGRSAWIRPRPRAGLPHSTRWTSSVTELREHLLRLRRIHHWHSLESPGSSAPYRLQILKNGTTYGLALRKAASEPPQRFYYAFSIDHAGRGVLLFPRQGSVENRFPLARDSSPQTIELRGSAFALAPPYGNDTLFLLSTDEPLPNPWLLELEGVRAGSLTLETGWSLEKIVLDGK